MTFLNPYFLFALFAVAVPIIIHLFNFRKYKKVFFSNVRYLQELKLEIRRKSQLRNLIVLLLRILAITALVFAFAQPYIPHKQQSANPKAVNYISIYIDNSFSMQAEGSRGSLIDEAKHKAIEIASAYRSGDHFQLLTNDFEARHRQFVTRDEFSEMVRGLELSPISRSLQDIAKRQLEIFSTLKGSSNIAYVISDFQKTTCKPEMFIPDTSINYFLVPVNANNINNLYIDTCWFESPVHLTGQTVKLFISIKNNSAEAIEKVPLRLYINKVQKAVNSFNIGPNGTAGVVISYIDHEAGVHHGMIEITDNPIIFDDKFYFSYNILPSVPVLSINGKQPSPFLNSLMAEDSAFTYQNTPVGQVNYNALNSYNLIIINELEDISTGLAQELQKFVSNGGHLLVIPSEKINIENYRQFLSSLGSNYYTSLLKAAQKIATINLQNPVFTDVFESIPQNMDMPQVTSYYAISRISRSVQEYLLKLQNGDIFLDVQSCGNGKVYLLAIPLQTSFSNFPRHALFVPTIYKIALLSRMQNKLYYTIGEESVLEMPLVYEEGKDLVVKLKHTEKEIEIIPGIQKMPGKTALMVNQQVKESGNYELSGEKKLINGIAFNYNSDESDLRVATPDEIKQHINKSHLKNAQLLEAKVKSLPLLISELNQGIKLWKTFVLLALLFLAGEVIILRFWK